MLKANGVFRHSFTGSSCVGIIGLIFVSAEEARDALSVLGISWEQAKKDPKVLTCAPSTSEELSNIKAILKEKCGLTITSCGWKHCRKQCKNAEIDNLAHSVDVGARFTVEIPRPIPKEQMSLYDRSQDPDKVFDDYTGP